MRDQRVLEHAAVNVAAGDVVADAELVRLVVPALVLVQRRRVDAARDEDAAGLLLDGLQGALDAVKDVLHDARAQLDGERLARPEHRVADGQTGCSSTDANKPTRIS